ncbi:hypothetical protein PHISCL_01962 [Aspergillus sclerotialis]|uniref:Phosphotransferase enzyme family n=1 Tax=Aspergillus sclerotialis TaxID=2070753 RepID=A0A3A2ZRB7_9EURO|nr:hypothetical protein PHISCL_01962 [Aspergillus sclerotialis]
MVNSHHNIIWFDSDQWIGSEITFNYHNSKWRLDEKLNEAADYDESDMVKEGILDSEARGTFACTNIHDQSQQAIIKIRMQIPYFNTAFKARKKRAEQANADMRFATKREIEVLEYLTKAGCSSSPAFLASKHETQDEDGWVPGGYLDYILMEKIPGVRPPYWTGGMDRWERDCLREAFKEAWLECVKCGRLNRDEAIRNLLWDSKKRKCYIVDWEDWVESTEKDLSRDTLYIGWNLAWNRTGTLKDMSTWDL